MSGSNKKTKSKQEGQVTDEIQVGKRRTKRSAPGGTKHSAVTLALLQEIENGVWSAGDRIPSEQDIATKFGVAYMTARQAVSTLVGQGVLVRLGRKGTFVADKKLSQPLKRFRFVMLIEGDGKPSLDPYYLPPVIGEFERCVRSHGQDFVVYGYSTAILEQLLAKDDIVCCVLLNEPEILYANLLSECNRRVYAINRCPSGSRVPFVMPDNEGGARAATEHLLNLGHRRIGFIRGLSGNIDAAERQRGYFQAMADFGAPPGPVDGNHFIESCGYEAATRMLSGEDPPTAIFCASDLSAIGAMKAVVEAGLSVPQDVSVMGFGDFPVAEFLHPGLSTVRLPLGDLGQTAAREMLRLSEGQKVDISVLPCELVLRDTTAEVSRLTARAG
jgi:DNA-binding LacI/PurR family transcriptional regulator